MVVIGDNSMTKKSFIVILILSIVISIFVPVAAFTLGVRFMSDGFPLKWSTSFGLGSSTDYNALLLDIILGFIVIWGVWKLIQNSKKKK